MADPRIRLAVIILAGGSGTRAGGDVNKVLMPLLGRPVLSYSIEAFARRASRLLVVGRREDRESIEATELVEGGPSRHQSEWAGLSALAADIEEGGIDLVGIHDGARPLVTADLITRVTKAAWAVGGAIPVLPLERPVFRTGDDQPVEVAQARLVRAQTPQVFRARELLEAYRRAEAARFEGVDTAETVGGFSELDVAAVEGEPDNLKLTYPADFRRAEGILRARAGSGPGSGSPHQSPRP